jgi:hypothetical protein
MKRISTIFLLFAAACAAKDAIQASVTPVSGPAPIVVVNGNPYSNGTFAAGTIRLTYTINAFQFPTVTDIARFQVGLSDVHYSANPETTYSGLALSLTQTGSPNVLLSANPATFHPTGSGWSATSLVSISVPASVASNPTLNVDGAELIANLQLVTTPQGAQLDTVTTIQVHLMLVHPTSCLRVFNFITDETFTTTVTATEVNVAGQPPSVKSTNPFGQFSDNVLVVNTCGTPQNFSVGTTLDTAFETSPKGNPGNAVFTYTKNGYTSPATLNLASFGTGTAQGQQLCLTGISLAAGDSFLETVHMAIKKGISPSLLPSSGAFGFSARVYAGSACSGNLLTNATTNPATTALTFTVK